MSRHLKDFLSRAEQRFQENNLETPYGEWITQNTVLRGRPFSMDKYPFQRAIADDMHPNLAVLKCSQVGLTEVQVRKVLAFVKRNRGVNAIYTLPDEKMFKKVSQMRVKPCIEENPVFQPDDGEKAVRSMSTMQFGTSFLLVTNATEGAATSTPADMLVHDEVDLSDQHMLSLFQSRMQNSEWKLKHNFSTPTFYGYGIDADFEVTDQREYTCRCYRCNHEQVPDFTREFVVIPGLPDDVEDLALITEGMMPKLDLDDAYVQCQRCGAPLDLDSPDRRWVATRPEVRHARGYRVRPLSTSRIGIPYIIGQLLEYKRRDYLRGWYNTTLGKPYIDGNIRLERTDIEACMTNEISRPDDIDASRPHVLGIDMGAICHLTLGVGESADNCEVVLFEQVPSDQIVDRVKGLCKQVNIIAGAVDRHPYTPTANDIFEASGKKVFPVEYRGSLELNFVYDEFKEPVYAQADKTALLDALAKAVRKGGIRLSGFGHQKETVITHFRDNIRDEKPDVPARWVKLKGDDHYFHAAGFMLFAYRLFQALRPLKTVEARSTVEIAGVDWMPNNFGLLLPGSYNQGLL